MLFTKSWDPKGKHCYITGGTAGLGLSLAILLVKRGANVSIVARNRPRLQSALDDLEYVRVHASQRIHGYSFEMNDASQSSKALEDACKMYDNVPPDAVFCCAGSSTPGFFVEQDETSMRNGFDQTYWAQAWTALAASKMMVKHHLAGKIIFVSSYLGLMSLVGYSTYSPGQHALRGLAETLRSELQLYDIGIHIFFPGIIYSPGYEEENKTKPAVTLKIQEVDAGMTPEQSALNLLKGVQHGDFHITADFLGNLFRTSTRGASPNNNFFLDGITSLVGNIGLPLWRRRVDGLVRKHREEHQAYLKNSILSTDDATNL